MSASNLEVIHAYRHLYRSLLQAVRYSSPARYVARDQLRAAFRDSHLQPSSASSSSQQQPVVLDREGVKRTVWFFKAAAKERGLEHRILKNLIAVRLKRNADMRVWKRAVHESRKKGNMKHWQQNSMRHYDMTVAMLNKTMGLCLR